MNFYPFSSNSEWLIAEEFTEQWGNANPIDIMAVLNSVKQCYETYFETSYVNELPLTVAYSSTAPMTLRKGKRIFLSVKGTFWCQYIYQFSHELCHYMIKNDIHGKLRWFEESICEMASLFFLGKTAELWNISPPYPSWRTYSDSISSYLHDVYNKQLWIDGLCSAQFMMKNLHILEDDPYCRPLNHICARLMLPFFTVNTSIWKEVPRLIKIIPTPSLTPSATFLNALSERQDIVSVESKNDIGVIFQLFSDAF